MRMTRFSSILASLFSIILLSGCSDSSDHGPSQPDPEPPVAAGPNYAPPNPFLADSVAPIGHINSAQSTGVKHAGPAGPSERLLLEDGSLNYAHVGPAHFGLAISPPYPDGSRVIWSNGGERISKLDYETLAVIDEFFLEDSAIYLANGGPITEEQADADSADSADQRSVIGIKDEWVKPPEITGSFNSINMTYDGWICSTTEDGWIVVIRQDFSEYRAIRLTGAEVAPLWNDYMVNVEGRRAGSSAWVRNGAAIDEHGGIYVPSLQHMHKVIWDGNSLSRDEADGAWVAQYSNEGPISVSFEGVVDPETGEPYTAVFENVNIGSGSTASLMGFGDEDQFVVITDGDEVMNMVLFWRNEIPEVWERLEQAPNRRIAGMLRADIGDREAAAVQTEQSVVVGGYGAFVVNNSPASKPLPNAPDGFYVGYAGHHPDFTPRGTQKFQWDPEARELKEAWVNQVSSINSVPLVSNEANLVYTAGAREGEYTLEAIDWDTGESAFHYVTGSSRFNTVFSGLFLDNEGRVIHSGFHGITRYERLPD